MSENKKSKSLILGEIRAINRVLKYLPKVQWAFESEVEAFREKMFTPHTKRNSKAYFRGLAMIFEEFFHELFMDLDQNSERYAAYQNLRDSLRERITKDETPEEDI